MSTSVAAVGLCLIVDARSFARRPLLQEPDQAPDQPAILIGTDAFHPPPTVCYAAVAAATACGWTVAFDMPLARSLVPAAVLRRDPRALFLMISVRRELYMDEDTAKTRPTLARDNAAVASPCLSRPKRR